jgi:peptidoglycan-associated lipoprotein
MTVEFRRGRVSRVLGFALCSSLVALTGCHDESKVTSGQDGNTMIALPPERFGSGINAADRIFFDYDSSRITPEARTILERIAAAAKTNPQQSFTIEGHCDDRGTREYNLALGERRAEATRNAEMALGVEAGRLQSVSYGKERPAVIGENEAAWAQNRRAVFVVN